MKKYKTSEYTNNRNANVFKKTKKTLKTYSGDVSAKCYYGGNGVGLLKRYPVLY